MDPAVMDDRRRTVSLSHRKWRFWAETGMMRGRAGMRWDARGSWNLTWLIVGRLGCWGLVVGGIVRVAWVEVRTNVGV